MGLALKAVDPVGMGALHCLSQVWVFLDGTNDGHQFLGFDTIDSLHLLSHTIVLPRRNLIVFEDKVLAMSGDPPQNKASACDCHTMVLLFRLLPGIRQRKGFMERISMPRLLCPSLICTYRAIDTLFIEIHRQAMANTRLNIGIIQRLFSDSALVLAGSWPKQRSTGS